MLQAFIFGFGFFAGFFVCARLMEHTYTARIKALEGLLRELSPYPREPAEELSDRNARR